MQFSENLPQKNIKKKDILKGLGSAVAECLAAGVSATSDSTAAERCSLGGEQAGQLHTAQWPVLFKLLESDRVVYFRYI